MNKIVHARVTRGIMIVNWLVLGTAALIGARQSAPLDRYDVRVVLVEPNAPLAAQLEQEGGWKKVYADRQAVIYAR